MAPSPFFNVRDSLSESRAHTYQRIVQRTQEFNLPGRVVVGGGSGVVDAYNKERQNVVVVVVVVGDTKRKRGWREGRGDWQANSKAAVVRVCRRDREREALTDSAILRRRREYRRRCEGRTDVDYGGLT